MRTQPPLIPYLENVRRWVWIAYIASFVAFIAIVFALDALSAPGTPANQLVTGSNGWLFLIPAGLVGYGFYVSARYWRCPQCKQYLPTQSWERVPGHCRRCGCALREDR
jgi:hypothetical protein